MKELSVEITWNTSAKGLAGDTWIYAVPASKSDAKIEQVSKLLPDDIQSEFSSFAKARKFESKAGSSFSFDSSQGSRQSVCLFDLELGMFEWLSMSRKIVADAIFSIKSKSVVIDLRGISKNVPQITDALVSSIAAAAYKFPKYKSPAKDKSAAKKEDQDEDNLEIHFIVDRSDLKAVEKVSHRALTTTVAGTNLVRWLAKRAGNDLNCLAYVNYVKQLAKVRKWKLDHIDHPKLTKMGAGAFLAVVQGSEHKDYGIIKVSYDPKGSKKEIALVGKGMTYDTGGHSIKPSQYMLGMHGDMAGSAVALAVLNVATLEQWPIKITAYLAIADNMIGPKAYKPNDVITAMNGTTIEVIDTDAEGRMVLADTLHIASLDNPDLLMDFATLTGSCVRAIGTTFSGVFGNRPALYPGLTEAGYRSGERVWPFPMDKDFADCLDSTSADTKQCREKGGVDHIEASQFLSKFVNEKTSWVHVDLSAIEHSGGLAHVPTDETGFGVRFASEFISNHFNLKL